MQLRSGPVRLNLQFLHRSFDRLPVHYTRNHSPQTLNEHSGSTIGHVGFLGVVVPNGQRASAEIPLRWQEALDAGKQGYGF